MADDLAAQGVSVILTSADGVLERVCSDAKMVRALDEVGLSRAYSYAEEFAGTNGIGTSLGAAHLHPRRRALHGTLGRLACAGAPIRDAITGEVVGVIDLTCWASQSDPPLFALAKSAGSQIEDRMSALAYENETALLEAYLRECHRFLRPSSSWRIEPSSPPATWTIEEYTIGDLVSVRPRPSDTGQRPEGAGRLSATGYWPPGGQDW